jgi:hypothetical protein
MPRYKDRTDPKQIEKIERTFPHIIEIIVPLGGFGKKLDDMYEWHFARDIEAMRGCGWRDENGRFYVPMVLCQFDHGSGLCSQVWRFDSDGAIKLAAFIHSCQPIVAEHSNRRIAS